jgi:hypothetical protein
MLGLPPILLVCEKCKERQRKIIDAWKRAESMAEFARSLFEQETTE